MKKHLHLLLYISTVAIISAVLVLLLLFLPFKSVWDIAELIRQDDDFDIIWIADSQYHSHAINSSSEQHSDAIKALNGLKLSHREIGGYTYGESKNMFVLESVADHRVQYFLFNEDFTKVWAVDNSWIGEHSELTQYEEICAVYRVKNPWMVKRFFEGVCNRDTKYDMGEGV